MYKKTKAKTLFTGFFLSCMMTLTTLVAYAEDTEIYKNIAPPANSNVMFILDLSASMSTDIAGFNVAEDDPSSRLNIMKNALITVLNDPEIKNINMGLMGFSGIVVGEGRANGPTLPVSDVEAPTDLTLALNPTFNPTIDDSTISTSISAQKDKLKSKFPWLAGKKDDWLEKTFAESFTKTKTRTKPNKATTEEINTKEFIQIASSVWEAEGNTPIVDSLYEATLYFKGKDVDFGKYLATDRHSAHPSSYVGELKLETLPPKEICPRTECYDPECHSITKVCTDYSAGTDTVNCDSGDTLAECQAKHPTWFDCYYHTSESCSTTCPKNQYDELNNCKEPETTCTPNNYYRCQAPYNAGKDCTHEDPNDCYQYSETVVTGTPTYISPIKNECQSSRYILLSDGEPTENHSANNVNGMIPAGYSNSCQNKGDSSTKDLEYYGRCGVELVKYLHNEDQSTLDGKQTIETTTIGFALNSNPAASAYLKLLATKGGGEFYSADDLNTLTDSFKNALLGTTKKARLFTTPSFSVDPSRLLEHSSAVYLPMFASNRKPRWNGNLKKFKLLNHTIADKSNTAATDHKGTLRPDAQDEWATSIPDDAIKGGGAASLLDPANRNLLTDTSSGLTLQTLNKSSATKTLLGDELMEDEVQDALLNFIQGYEKDGTTARKHMGDIVHSKPVVVTYGAKKRIFVGTNEGFLHAFDDNGIEKFAFMPKMLLKNIDVQYRNDSTDAHLSGVDGEITTWMSDPNHNGQWDTGEKVILFFGLRRGGKAYYALDVSNPDSDPKLLWRIDSSMTGFSELGQTWSTPVLTQLRYGGDPADSKLKPVLIFGGGYNTRIDEADKSLRSTATTSNSGTTVFIVDAVGNSNGTTNILWKANHNDMKYAIPGNIRALDMDRNGSVDRLYFGDMGGNIWRVDLNAGNFSATPSMHDLSKAKVTKFAELGDNTGSDLRKFFYEPDVAFFRHGGKFLLTVAIGSGYRAHPLNESIVDRFYVLRDQYVLRTPDSNFKTITETGSATPIKAPIDKTKKLLANDYYGWYRDLTAINHEKVLATATTFMNRVSFTSFGKTAPKAMEEGSCDTVTNFQSRAYVLGLLRGDAVIDFGSGKKPSTPVSTDEIVATPQIIFGNVKPSTGTKCTKDDCHQSITMRIGKLNKPFVDDTTAGGNVDITTLIPKVFWREEEK
ncbi:MAG: hypothetical protein KAH00_05620 [Cocleimonas sp.]|nr:hypothetical protein [Cocleimonas sp.]